MQKKRALSNSRSSKVDLTDFLNELHTIQLECIDEALEQSDLREAKELIEHIRSKCE